MNTATLRAGSGPLPRKLADALEYQQTVKERVESARAQITTLRQEIRTLDAELRVDLASVVGSPGARWIPEPESGGRDYVAFPRDNVVWEQPFLTTTGAIKRRDPEKGGYLQLVAPADEAVTTRVQARQKAEAIGSKEEQIREAEKNIRKYTSGAYDRVHGALAEIGQRVLAQDPDLFVVPQGGAVGESVQLDLRVTQERGLAAEVVLTEGQNVFVEFNGQANRDYGGWHAVAFQEAAPSGTPEALWSGLD